MAVDEQRRAHLIQVAEEAGRRLDQAAPQAVLEWALDTFGDTMCIAASMADAVLIDMASRIRPGAHVIFLDTGYHFRETLDTRARVSLRYPITLQTMLPKQTVAEQDELFGSCLHDRDPDACCSLRKVEPLRRGLAPYDAWASGIRRDETSARSTIGVVEWDSNRGMVKVNPLAAWTQAQVDDYILEHDVITNPLMAQGYPSIGCQPCTRKVAPGENARSGRWAGSDKSECGLHLDSSGRLVRRSTA